MTRFQAILLIAALTAFGFVGSWLLEMPELKFGACFLLGSLIVTILFDAEAVVLRDRKRGGGR